MTSQRLRIAAALMRERAEAATPGPWVALVDGIYVGPEWDDNGWLSYDALVVEMEFDDDEPTADAAHIAAADPTFMLAVADLLENEASLIASAGERPDLHMPLNGARVDLLVALADTYLAEDARLDAR